MASFSTHYKDGWKDLNVNQINIDYSKGLSKTLTL